MLLLLIVPNLAEWRAAWRQESMTLMTTVPPVPLRELVWGSVISTAVAALTALPTAVMASVLARGKCGGTES
jgi:hypothetical protein